MHVFPAIDESIFSSLYSSKASRPNTPVNVIVGALILKEALGDTDDELVEALMFDIRYQYALHTTSVQRVIIRVNLMIQANTNFLFVY